MKRDPEQVNSPSKYLYHLTSGKATESSARRSQEAHDVPEDALLSQQQQPFHGLNKA